MRRCSNMGVAPKSANACRHQGRGGAWEHRRCGTSLLLKQWPSRFCHWQWRVQTAQAHWPRQPPRASKAIHVERVPKASSRYHIFFWKGSALAFGHPETLPRAYKAIHGCPKTIQHKDTGHCKAGFSSSAWPPSIKPLCKAYKAFHGCLPHRLFK